MNASEQNAQGSITRLYRTVTRLYTELPYRFSRSGRAFPAWHFFFEITRRCNLRCKMCQYIQWLQNTPAREQREGELTTGEWHNVIDQTGRFSLITFTGGEVYVRRDFEELFEHACAKRRVHFISNATMLTEARARRCVELAPRRLGGRGFNFAGVSLDGPREVHDVIRAQSGAFDKSVNGIKALSAFRRESGKTCPLIHVSTVIQRDNVDVLHEMPRLVAEIGGDVLNLLTEMRSHDIQELGHVDPATISRADIASPRIDRTQLARALVRTQEAARAAGIELRTPRMPFEDVLNHYDGGYDLGAFECRAVWNNCYVGSKGNVYPCFIMKVGNVREQSLGEIWNGSKMREFRRRRREGGFAACRGCCELEHAGKREKAVQPGSPAVEPRSPAAG